MMLPYASAAPGLLILLAIGSAQAQTQEPVDPLAVVQGLIRQQQELDVQRDRNEAMRLELERRNLEDQLRYQRASDQQIMGEMARYCPPNGEPPCAAQPPQPLLQEAARRGLIAFAPQPPSGPSADCVTLGDGLGGGITDCAIH